MQSYVSIVINITLMDDNFRHIVLEKIIINTNHHVIVTNICVLNFRI